MKHKIIPIKLLEDELGAYIPYCSYKNHRGIALKYRLCEKRDCRHYLKYRAESPIKRYTNI